MAALCCQPTIAAQGVSGTHSIWVILTAGEQSNGAIGTPSCATARSARHPAQRHDRHAILRGGTMYNKENELAMRAYGDERY
jgi:hypothetical protein